MAREYEGFHFVLINRQDKDDGEGENHEASQNWESK